jgi:hypothetical protein
MAAIISAAAARAHALNIIESNRTPKERADIAYNSNAGRSFRKHNPVAAKETAMDIYKTSSQKVQLKLSFLILTYLYSQDDQKLSKKEVKDIKKLIEKEATEFSSDDLIEVFGFFKLLPNMQYVLNYIEENNIDDYVFNRSYDLARENFKSKKVYVDLLVSLKKAHKSLYE